jgi:mannonate dehydratase
VSVLAAAPWPSRSGSRVTGVRTFLTAPQGSPYLIVRVETDQPGLYGLGCGSDPQRTLAVKSVVDDYLGPMLLGRDPGDVEDIHRLLLNSGYWRGGSIEGNALGALDVALWDIKAKAAGMPLYALLGGRVRDGAAAYTHVGGADVAEVVEGVLAVVARGFRHVRVQVAVPGTDTYGTGAVSGARERDARWDSEAYLRWVPRVLREVRSRVPDDVELLHDAHERLTPAQARRFVGGRRVLSGAAGGFAGAAGDGGAVPRRDAVPPAGAGPRDRLRTHPHPDVGRPHAGTQTGGAV